MRRFVQADTDPNAKGAWTGPEPGNPQALNNPVKYNGPSGHEGLEFALSEIPRVIRQSELWAFYYTGADVAGILLPHVGDHMQHFLMGSGTPIEYTGEEADWIQQSPALDDIAIEMRSAAFDTIRKQLEQGITTGSVDARNGLRLAEGDDDFYYAINACDVGLTVFYDAQPIDTGGYDVTLIEIRNTTDTYDWHPGLTAGGDVWWLRWIPDSWTAELAAANWATEYDVTGEWYEEPYELPFGPGMH